MVIKNDSLVTPGHGEESATSSPRSSIPSWVNTESIKALLDLSIDNDYAKAIFQHVAKPFDIKTPPEKVKKRPDGYDYVESSYMDYQTKSHIPLYEYRLLHISFESGWINVIVSLTDRITGNTELGADSARIQVSRGAEAPNFRDIIDMGNNLKSSLSKAIKNAQARFGFSADVYQRRESIPTDSERMRYEQMSKEISTLSPSRASTFKEQWSNLGTDWSEFLDKWQAFIDRKSKQ
jgi:hypothetical protein